MKILFIYPRFIKYLENFPGTKFEGAEGFNGYSYPPALGIPQLAAVTPDKHECVFHDENVEPVDFDTDADVIALSFFTPQAASAFRICKGFQGRGKVVVAGGVHPSVRPEEVKKYADIVCIGEGEHIWQQILEDIESGSWSHEYRQDKATDLSTLAGPNREVFPKSADCYDIHIDYLELSRGCNSTFCDTCVVPRVSGKCLRVKNIDRIVNDVQQLRYPMCFVTDDIVFMQRDTKLRGFLIELFDEIAKTNHGHGFFISNVPSYPLNAKLLASMSRAGATVSYCTFGFDPLTNEIMSRGSKDKWWLVADQIKAAQDLGMLVYAAFHLGFDEQSVAVEDNVLEFCEAAGIKLAQFCLKVPWPGTEMWDKLNAQGRILHTKWDLYNGANVVFAPKLMTEEELSRVFVSLWQRFSPQYHRLNELQRSGVVDFNSDL